jgi:glucosamine 6-phosphate synthetase-like amidotransferase/phosphosugar isomerase protein
VLHKTSPNRRGRATETPPLVIGLGDGELHLGSMSRPSSSTRRAMAIGQDQLCD